MHNQPLQSLGQTTKYHSIIRKVDSIMSYFVIFGCHLRSVIQKNFL